MPRLRRIQMTTLMVYLGPVALLASMILGAGSFYQAPRRRR